MPTCTDCGGTVIEYDAAAGNGFCIVCGTVVEENTIVNEVVFGETSSGAAMVQGSFVGLGSTHARMSGPYGNRGNSESREQTIANASKKIQSIANILRLSESVCLAATRMYTLAVEHKFTKGRKSMNVVAVCLYVACRQKETRNYMLIDFSDLLQVNVFELGHTYLQLVQTLNLRLPLVDPSHYISRFSALLEFGDETHKVATDAVRLVQRFDRDWMTRGRRPAGICGAALLLAARMNNFRRSMEEIVQVVKIADTTLKKRLDEFKNTPSGELTVGDFRSVWLDEEIDPPAFTKGREKEEEERLIREGDEEALVKLRKKKGRRKVKRKREESDEEVIPDMSEQVAKGFDSSLLNEGILSGTTVGPTPLFYPAPDDVPIDPAFLDTPSIPAHTVIDETVSTAVAEEVSAYLQNPQGAMLSGALDEAEQRRLAGISVVDELTGLDEEELDRFLLSEEEVKIKERVWVELNRDYLEALAAKGDQSNSTTRSKKRRKTKPRDSTTAHGATTAESVKNMMKKNPKYSKRINYDALKDLFVNGGVVPTLDEKDEASLYTMDDKSDGEGGGALLVIEEDSAPPPPPLPEDDKDDDKEDEDAAADDISWDDAYEQEV
ncbi:BRF1-domain-containing protein [Desarmillaria ectypa]|nr:BRF1-domain-containing protein [Desarmillaria ectypa]